MKNGKLLITLIISAALAFVLIAGWYVLFVQYQELKDTLQVLQDAVHTGNDTRDALTETLELNQQILLHSLNESREILRLPTISRMMISTDPEEPSTRPDAGEDKYSQLLFQKGITYFSEYYQRRELEYLLNDVLRYESKEPLLSQSGLVLKETGSVQYLITDKQGSAAVFQLEAVKMNEGPFIRIESLFGEEEFIALEKESELSATRLTAALSEHIRKLKEIRRDREAKIAGFKGIIEEIGGYGDIREKELIFEMPEEIEPYTDFTCRIHGLDGLEVPVSAGIDFITGQYRVNDEGFDKPGVFAEKLEKVLADLDMRTESEKRIDELKIVLEDLSADPVFQSFLDENSLRMSQVPREEGDYLYYDLMKPDGSRFGAFSILKKLGKIYLSDEDDVVITSLMTVELEPLFSTAQSGNSGGGDTLELPDASYFSKAGRAADAIILLCGTHEGNADTIMIASLEDGSRIRLLSIPRDIYFKYRKLGTHYRLHGIDRLKSMIEEMTGLKIDGYISVDMYAFIDVIDVLNGIDIYLEAPLRDPTYRVRENGNWTTLYYPEGNHHLNGIEALRVVRSRHTSDDFERGYRQQLVIGALYDKLNKLHSGKIKEVYDLFSILHEYVKTDLNAYELTQYFLRYHDASIDARKSVSTDNVLYTTYSNLYLSGLKREDVDEGFDLGAWILLPKEEDWGLVYRFVQNELYE